MSKVYIFDLDGTLVDSAKTYINFCNAQNKKLKLNLPFIDSSNLKECRKSLNVPFEVLLSEYGFPKEIVYGLKDFQEFDRFYVKNPPKLFKGIGKLINSLKKQDYTLGIVTSNIEENMRAGLKETINLFEFYACAKEKKGFYKKDILAKIEKEFSGNTTYIGDTGTDAKASGDAGIDNFIWVSWGWREPIPPFNEEYKIANTVEELEKLLIKQ